MKIAFFGLGKMGLGAALNLQAAGFEVHTAIHRSATGAEKLKQAGGVIDSSPEKAVQDAEYIFSIVPDDAALYSLVTAELLAAAKPGALWIEMTSCSDEAMCQIAKLLSQHAVKVLDAPVSGGTKSAEAGTMTMMCAGSREAWEQAQSVLRVICGSLFYVSENVGDGKKIKMLNNLLSAMNKAAAGEVWRIAERSGLAPEQVFRVITASSGDSNGFRQAWPKLENGDFQASFTVEHMKKDVELALRLTNGLSCPLSSLTQAYFDETVKRFPGEDSSAVAKTELK